MTQTLQSRTENNFIYGYNDKDKPENLFKRKDGKVYMADIKNAWVEENKIIKRKGYSDIGNAPEEKAILGQNRHEPSGGTKYILRARNNEDDSNAVIEGWSGTGNWAILTGGDSQTEDLKHEFIMAENATYIFDGTDTVLKTTNGTSVSEVAAAPKGTTGKWWHNFFFIIGVTGNKSRLYFSDVNEPETYDAVNGYIDINADDNEENYALAAMGDELLIFKQTSVFMLTGYGTTDFTLDDMRDLGSGIGTIAPRSIVETGKDVYYLTYSGQTPHFKSIQRTRYGELVDGGIISDNITGTMNRIQKAQIANCAGLYDGRRVWFSICTTGTTNNEVVVCDTLTNGWVRHTGINANVFHLSNIGSYNEIYFGDSTATGLSYKFDTSTNDNGAAIDFAVDTPMYHIEIGRKARFKYLYVVADVGSDIDLDIDYSKDGFTFDDLTTMDLTSEGAAFGTAVFDESKFGSTTIARERVFAGGQSYFMQYRFANANADEDISIREWQLYYASKGLRAT